MQMNISVRHGHVSEATQAVVREKLEKLTRLYDRISAIELTVDMEHRDPPAVDLKVSAKKHDFVATGQAENLLAAVDTGGRPHGAATAESTKRRCKTAIATPGTGREAGQFSRPTKGEMTHEVCRLYLSRRHHRASSTPSIRKGRFARWSRRSARRARSRTRS